MSCEECIETVLALTDVAENATARRNLSETLSHVDSCQVCKARLEFAARIAAPFRENSPPIEPAGGWAALDRRLLQNLDLGVPNQQRRPTIMNWSRGLVGITACLAAITLAFWCGQNLLSRREQAGQGAIKPISPEMLKQSEVLTATKAFVKMSEEYDGKARWVLVSDSANTETSQELGLSNRPVQAAPLVDVLRLMMRQGPTVVSVVDLVVVSGQSADLSVRLPSNQTIHYRVGTTTGDNSKIELLAEVKTPGVDRPIAILSTTLDLQPSGQTVSGDLQTLAGLYQLRGSFLRTALPQDVK